MKRIVYVTESKGVAVIAPTSEYLETHTIEDVAAKDVPAGAKFSIVNTDTLPSDNEFFGAWELVNDAVLVNIDKAKAIGHELRRAARADEFKPFDEAISKQIPGTEGAEAARQAIRDKYAVIQTQINAATTPDEIKTALGL